MMPSDPTKPWGPDNPHPLATRKTELVWEGKYDEYGNRRAVSIPTFPLVLQKIETINAPRDEAIGADMRDLFDKTSPHLKDFRNRLIWGDNKLALAALLQEFRGKVDLIYIDPPFDVGADFTMNVPLANDAEDSDSEVFKEQSVLEAVAYRDMWGKGTDSYLQMMYERFMLMRDLLTPEGVIFVHCDWRVNSHMRLLLNDIFGADNFRNEIVWRRAPNLGRQAAAKQLGRVIDTIYVYSKLSGSLFRGEAPMRSEPVALDAKGNPKGAKWDPERQCFFTTAPRGDYTDESVARLRTEGRIYDSNTGQIYIKYFLRQDENGVWTKDQPVDTLWTDSAVKPLRHCTQDELGIGYSTQKPEGLLNRIVEWASTEGDLVLDCFCGSGTTAAVAEKLGRKWIAVDLGRYAIHTTRKRLIGVQRELQAGNKPYRSFDVYNLGRYERQWWQMERLKGANTEHRVTVLKFFRAAPIANSPSPLLHGTRSGAYVYVDNIDSTLTGGELREVAQAAASVNARELICLAWEFEMDLRQRARALEAEHNLKISLRYIPREIMEANRDTVQFFEAGYLEAKAVVKPDPKDKKRKVVDVELVGFAPSLAEVPEKELTELRDRAVKSPFDFIDFWAVDFEYTDGKAFEHHWQDYRTRKDRTLKTTSDAQHAYAMPGKKRICVKVIDVFGVDTTTIVEVTI